MFIKRFYHEALGHASYVVGCQKNKKAVVVDPGRIVKPYIDLCKEMGFSLEAVAETHIHADYVSGAKELWREEDCLWCFSREKESETSYETQILLDDGDTFNIGDIRFEVISTPGHTPEHICYLVTNQELNVPVGLFSGDFLFVGDIGRPDLLEKAVGLMGSAVTGAKQMYQSLQKLSSLPDYIQIWPSHGAGSLCGKSLGSIPSSTLGYERRTNWAFQEKNEKKFIDTLLESQPDVPAYFAKMKKVNLEGPNLMKDINISTVSLQDVSDDAMIIDVRNNLEFQQKYLPGTINIPYNKSFIRWAGWLLTEDQPIFIICREEDIEAIKKDLLYIGFDNLAGFLRSDDLFKETEKIKKTFGAYPSIPIEEMTKRVALENMVLLDVRQDNEWNEGHIPKAIHIPLGQLSLRLEEVPKEKSVGVYCQSGIRSAIATSILKRYGFDNVVNVQGGYLNWKMKCKTVLK